MAKTLVLNPDRLFPAEPSVRAVARRLHDAVKTLPIISPHRHTDPEWFATNAPFEDATSLLLAPDHDLHRRLYSRGMPLDALGVDCAYVARLVAEHRLDEDEAAEVAVDLAYNLPKRAYRLDTLPERARQLVI